MRKEKAMKSKKEVISEAKALIIKGHTKQSEVARMIGVQPAVLSRYSQEWLGWDIFVKETILNLFRER